MDIEGLSKVYPSRSTTNPVAAKRHLGVVSQHNTLDRQVNAFENLYLHCRYYGIGRSDGPTACDLAAGRVRASRPGDGIGLGALGRSGRRLQVARALVHSPRAGVRRNGRGNR